MVDGWSTSFRIGPILGPPGGDHLAHTDIRPECEFTQGRLSLSAGGIAVASYRHHAKWTARVRPTGLRPIGSCVAQLPALRLEAVVERVALVLSQIERRLHECDDASFHLRGLMPLHPRDP